MNGSAKYETSDSPLSSTSKRDSLAAQLEQDPLLSTARRTLKADLFSSRMSTKSLERKVLAAENAKQELECALKEKDILIERLSSERRWLADKEQEERLEKARIQKTSAEEKKSLERTVRTLRTNLNDLEASHADLEQAHSELERELRSQSSTTQSLERQIALMEGELERTRELAAQQRDASRTLREQLENLELDRDRDYQRASASNTADDESWRVLREEMNRQMTHWKALEAANARLTIEVHSLRGKQTNVEVLREENRALERKVRKMVDQEEKVMELQGELDAARREREEWASFLADPTSSELSSHTPVALTAALSRLRLEHAELLEKQGSLASSLSHRDRELASLKSALASVTASSGAAEEHLAQERERSHRKERQLALAHREIAGLKALLATYDAEEARFTVKKESDEAWEDTTFSKFDEAKVQRLRMLEEEVTTLKATNQELESELAASASNIPDGEFEQMVAKNRDLEEELAESSRIADQALEKVEDLEQKLYELGATMNAGNLVPPNTRVLQLSANPVQEDIDLKKQVFDSLKQENLALIDRLGQVEQGAGLDSESRLVPRQSWENLFAEKNELVTKVADKEKRLLRLKQVFTAKTDEFRQTVSNILGYTLFFQPTKIRLTSTYNLAAAVTFQLDTASRSEQATMRLLGAGNGEDAGLTPRMNELIQHWIVERESIPCFMAALTLECFQRAQGGDPTPDATSASGMLFTRTIG